MDRFVYVIESPKGYLCDIEKYTSDITKAVVFVEYDTAAKKLATFGKFLTTECRINMRGLPFPHPVGFREI